MQDEFTAAAEEAKQLPKSVSNDDMLALYGLFKQAQVGDVNTCEFLKGFVLGGAGGYVSLTS